MTIEPLALPASVSEMADLIALLCDSVNHGASVGFLPPLSEAEARAWWETTLAEVTGGERVILAARDSTGIVGCVHLALPGKPNAAHRAEVQKLLVHTRARRQGLGEALMQAIEAEAAARGRTLLVLDTREGDDAPRLYRRLGYIEAGVIPGYALEADGSASGSIFFYRDLASPLASRRASSGPS